MNSICGICFEKTEELFRLNNSFIASCARCLKRAGDNNQKELFSQNTDISVGAEQECPICGKYFARRYSFMNHVRNHSAERKHICRYCQKAFTQAANLRNHERIHTNERPYSCSVCQKAFTQITNLNNHLRLHTGERPFQCPVEGCNKAFAQVTNLNNHAKTHQRDKHVKCYVCHKSFTHYSELSDHHRTHRLTNRCLYKDSKNKESNSLCLNKLFEASSIPHIKLEPQLMYGEKLDETYSAKDIYIDQTPPNLSIEKPKEEKSILPGLPMDFQNIYKTEQNRSQKTHELKSTKNNPDIRRDESNFHISCYFDNCGKKFEKNDDLNAHLNDIHGLSIFNRFDEKGMVKQYM